MDNITHSVVGLGIGALIDRSVPRETDPGAERMRTRMLMTLCCLASNFPDLDLVLTRLLEAPLGYLLHHRGHTHTLLAALGEAILLLGLVWLLWPSARRLLAASPRARIAAVGTACAGMVLHIAMDGLNVDHLDNAGAEAIATAIHGNTAALLYLADTIARANTTV